MSSVQSAYAEVKLPTKFSSLITPSYTDNVIVTGKSIDIPIPFTAANGVLDINVSQSSVIQAFVDAGTAPEDYAEIQGKWFGGAKVITSFGPNMTTYLRNWINTIETIGAAYAGPLVLYIQPVMTRVQLANPSFAINDSRPDGGPFQRDSSWGVTTEAPTGTEYTGGGTANKFFTTFIFKTPMTVRYVAPAGGFKYITMTSQFAEQ
jgi:hypothetical protein